MASQTRHAKSSHLPVAQQQLARQHKAQQHQLNGSRTHSPGHPGDDLPAVHCMLKQTHLAIEAMVAIVINGIHYAVLMASPHQLTELAYGFLYGEGLIGQASDVLDCETFVLNDEVSFAQFMDESRPNQHDAGDLNATFEASIKSSLQGYDVYVLNILVNQRCQHRIQKQRRQLAGRTGCGLCGIAGLEQALPDLSMYDKKPMPCPTLRYLLAIKDRLDTDQQAHLLTGAVHAACCLQDDALHVFEDVGRHNALDKLIGWHLKQHRQTGPTQANPLPNSAQAHIDTVIMTSRLSIELVQKSIRYRVGWLVGMSAPTHTAVQVAQQHGLGLAGFLRDNRVTYYT